MTRTESVRHAAATTKESVRHAAVVAAPYAGTAKDTAVHYAGEARRRIAPKVSSAAGQARDVARAQYDAYLAERIADRIAQAKGAVPPGVSTSAAQTVKHARETARQAAEYASPRVGHAVETARAAAEPVREEAVARGAAALAALRGQVSARDIDKLLHRQERRAKCGRFARRLMVLGTLAGGGVAVWRWWNRQANPDWLVEAPSPTEVADQTTTSETAADRAHLKSVDGPEGESDEPGQNPA
ncbi:DUF5324 family protein [Streptomyces sp. RB6PN25]|uniref:DUF5324 family protein n=1 Tax=Streptomyces humicola TaxID=2953240 RepID=A0ABT1Q3D8_9ACTN|nr:DUF5324 family protein [Streptomyces humicola]MCQ4083242.1 DUF5324 family protein [Streptomyces humicola]